MSNPVCWFNGELLPAHAARVPVLDHGLLYGDGVFEGIRFYNGKAFRLTAHLERLKRSAAALRLKIPLEAAALEQAVEMTISAYGDTEGYLRLVVTRGVGRLGLDTSSCTQPNVFIIADALAMVSETVRARGARVIIAATRRIGADALDPRIKSLNYLNHILARMEATNAGADEAILLNSRGHVAEGSADNVFVVRDGRLLTPPPADGALEGITRAAVLELAADLGIPMLEASFGPYDLYTADECFLTGTGIEFIPVREVDGRIIGGKPGGTYSRIVSAFRELVVRETTGASFATGKQG
jgi:branched-chain amino acid aminotransferase